MQLYVLWQKQLNLPIHYFVSTIGVSVNILHTNTFEVMKDMGTLLPHSLDFTDLAFWSEADVIYNSLWLFEHKILLFNLKSISNLASGTN